MKTAFASWKKFTRVNKTDIFARLIALCRCMIACILICNTWQRGVNLSDATKRAMKKSAPKNAAVMIRLDVKSKQILSKAAKMRGVSVSDFVREITVSQARRELEAAGENVLRLSPDEQLRFWNALHEPVALTANQRRLAKMMQGKA